MRPENTIAALHEGNRCSEYVKIDVRLSRDGVPVIIHDPTLDRTTNGIGRVSDHTLAELRELDAGEGELIPTLEEVLALDLGGCGLVIELKEAGYQDQIAAMVRESTLSKVLIVSFDADCLRRITSLLPEILVGSIFRSMEPDPFEVARAIPPAFILSRFDLVTPKIISSAAELDLGVIAWTPNTEEEYQEAFRLGVDGIVTDDPCDARRYIVQEARYELQ